MKNNQLTENSIEQLAIELLQAQGYQYIYGPKVAPASESTEYESLKRDDLSLVLISQ